MGLSLLWLITGVGPMWASELGQQPVAADYRADVGMLLEALKLLRFAYGAKGQAFDPVDHPEVTADAYELVRSSLGRLSLDQLIAFSRQITRPENVPADQ
jgi:hypothetical protein